MAGLYVHIPFCLSKCRYCDFVSFPGRQADWDAYLLRLAGEMSSFSGRVFETVYIGGGTPSLLSRDQLSGLFKAIQTHFTIAADAEISCEINPGTVTEALARHLYALGVNRVSLGAQSFSDRLLKTLGRAHASRDVARSLSLLRQAGFTNISLDLMQGIPGQTLGDAKASLEAAAASGTRHISCYSLTVEEGTPLSRDIQAGKLALPDEDAERAMADAAREILEGAGFRQYEISNFAQEGYACRHNCGYWRRLPYLGVGLAAHSFQNGTRTANTQDLDAYLYGVTVVSREQISPEESRFETLMLGLRMTEGISLHDFAAQYGVTFESLYGDTARRLERGGLLTWEKERVKLTRRGMDIQNTVLLELMEGI